MKELHESLVKLVLRKEFREVGGGADDLVLCSDVEEVVLAYLL